MGQKFALAFTFLALTTSALYAQTIATDSWSSPWANSTKLPATSEPATSSSTVPLKEDWTTISLAKSGLPMRAPGALLMTKGEVSGACVSEALRLEWRHGDPIDLYVIRPLEVSAPPVGLVLLNYTFDSAIFRNEYWCNQAKQNGLAIAALAPRSPCSVSTVRGQ